MNETSHLAIGVRTSALPLDLAAPPADRKDLRRVLAFVAELGTHLGPNLVRVSLFGSRARGDHRTRSDYDLMIVLEEASGAARTAIHGIAATWELEHNFDLSTKILGQDDFLRLRLEPSRFWSNFTKDEHPLWPMTFTSV